MPQGQFSAVVRYVRQVAGTPLSGETSDDELLMRFATRRDEAAFELLLWRHGAMVLRLCRDVTHDEHVAEDAFQAVFLALACKAGSIRSRKSLGAWLYQTAYRVALRARCRNRAIISVDRNQDLSKLASRAESGEELIHRELRSLLHEEVVDLPAKYRCPVILCYFEGFAHEDAARRLGWPKGTLAGRLARAREMLRKRLLRRGVALPAGLSAVAATSTLASANPLALLIQATLRRGLNMVVGGAVRGIDSPHVAALARGVLQEMFWSKSKVLGALLLCFGLAGGGVGLFAAIAPNQLAESSRKGDAPPRQNPIAKFEAARKFHVGIEYIRCLALSSDGKRFAVGGYKMAFGVPGLFQIGGPSQERYVGAELAHIVTCIAFSPDGRTVATGTFDGELKLWEAATCQERANLRVKVKGQPVTAVTFVDSDTLAVAAGPEETGFDNRRDELREVELWDLPTARKRATLKRAASPLAASADGKLLATGTMDWNVCLWDAKSAKPIRTLEGHDFPTKFIGFLPNGKELVTGVSLFNLKAKTSTAEVKVWNLESGKERILAKTDTIALACGAVSPDGRLVAIGSPKRDDKGRIMTVPAVTLLETKTGKVFATIPGDDEDVSAIVFTPTARRWHLQQTRTASTCGTYLRLRM